MKLWEVTNGWQGHSYVRCLVIAETAEKAVEAAKIKYQAEGTRGRYPDSYWEGLKAEYLCEDTTTPWVGELFDK